MGPDLNSKDNSRVTAAPAAVSHIFFVIAVDPIQCVALKQQEHISNLEQRFQHTCAVAALRTCTSVTAFVPTA